MIEFPGLWGLELTINKVAFTVFNIPIYWYGIIIAFSFLLSVLLALRKAKEFGVDPDTLIDLILFAAPVAIIFSRLYYVAFNWNDFKNDLLEIFNTRNGGLAIYGAVIGAVLVAWIFSKVRKIKIGKFIDLVAPYLVLAQAIGRWGNFVNQEAFGTNTTLPWGMTGDQIVKDLQNRVGVLSERGIIIDPNMPVHPTFLYESLWDFLVFGFLIWFRKKKKFDGEVFLYYMVLYGVGRALIEGLRTDSLMLGSIRISQLLAAVFAVACFTAILIKRRNLALSKSETDIDETGKSIYGAVLEEIRKEEGISDNTKADTSDDAEADTGEDAEERPEKDKSE
jgi:phosphatidylglycerol---prolipoprotein diacylglyceryl transferase